MEITTLTWNIGGGKLLVPGLAGTQGYSEDGLEVIAEYLAERRPDVITLQETQRIGEFDQAQAIANTLGYFCLHDTMSVSHIDPGAYLGNAILTPHRIINVRRGIFANPLLTATLKDGSSIRSHDKGYTTALLSVQGVEVAVTTLHLLPFRVFGLDLDSPVTKNILQSVQTELTHDFWPARWLGQGDTNLDVPTLREYLPTLFDSNTDEIVINQPTTPSGRSYDHIVFRGMRLLGHHIDSSVKTDHYPVSAYLMI